MGEKRECTVTPGLAGLPMVGLYNELLPILGVSYSRYTHFARSSSDKMMFLNGVEDKMIIPIYGNTHRGKHSCRFFAFR